MALSVIIFGSGASAAILLHLGQAPPSGGSIHFCFFPAFGWSSFCSMARTKQTARPSTGGKAPRMEVSTDVVRSFLTGSRLCGRGLRGASPSHRIRSILMVMVLSVIRRICCDPTLSGADAPDDRRGIAISRKHSVRFRSCIGLVGSFCSYGPHHTKRARSPTHGRKCVQEGSQPGCGAVLSDRQSHAPWPCACSVTLCMLRAEAQQR